MKYFHERLTTFREGIAGSNMKELSWLKSEVVELLKIGAREDVESLKNLSRIQHELSFMKKDDMRKRIELDQLACSILNRQEYILLK